MRGSLPKRGSVARFGSDPPMESVSRRLRGRNTTSSRLRSSSARLTPARLRKRVAARRLRRGPRGRVPQPATRRSRATPRYLRRARLRRWRRDLIRAADARPRAPGGARAASRSGRERRPQGGASTGLDLASTSTRAPRCSPRPDVVRGIRCTSIARTLLDLAANEPRRVVERAFEPGRRPRVLDAREIDDALERNNGHHGCGVLRAIACDLRPAALTRNELESLFLAICRAAGCRHPRSTRGSRSSRPATRRTSSGAASG